MFRSFAQVIVFLIVIGVVLTFASPYIDYRLMSMIVVLIGLGVLLWVLSLVGWIGGGPPVP